ncbi:MAG TPA: tetratricopeptide repeat protein [Burkholderiales bacterium]|nr:tetratricopeptide repeat protein [Burkholderiales bacterium]
MAGRLNAKHCGAALCAVLLAGCAAAGEHKDVYALSKEAEIAFDNQEDAKAEQLYKGLIKQAPNDAESWFRLGNLYARTNHPDQAVDAYQHALMLDGNNPKIWHNLGVVRLRQAWASLMQAEVLTSPDSGLYDETHDMVRLLGELPALGGASPKNDASASSSKTVPAKK